MPPEANSPGAVIPSGISQIPAPGQASPTAPLTPGNSVGATPDVPGVDAPMTPEHKAELAELLSKIKQEYMKWKSMSFGVQNQANEFRREQLKTVFQMLQAKGVDLNDQNSVSEFLARVKQTAPQHFDAITRALDYLLGTDYENEQQQQESPSTPPLPESPSF